MGDDFLGAALHADSAFSETIDKLRDVDRYFARRPPVAPASSDAGPGSADEQAGESKESEQQSEQQSEPESDDEGTWEANFERLLKRTAALPPLLLPLEVTGRLNREANGAATLKLSFSRLSVHLEDRAIATLHAWMGLIEGYSLWKHYILQKGLEPRAESLRVRAAARASTDGEQLKAKLARAACRRRWQMAGRAVIQTIVSKSPAGDGMHGAHFFAELAIHAARRRGYQELYLRLCHHSLSTFSPKTGRMETGEARRPRRGGHIGKTRTSWRRARSVTRQLQ